MYILLILNCPGAIAQQNTARQPASPNTPIVSWNNTFGDNSQDMAYAVIKVDDGYVVAGDWGNDIGLLKTDLNGNQIWRKTYGGDGKDSARAVIAVSDGYIIAGSSTSYENWGVSDVYLLKTDRWGNEEWHETYSHFLKGHMTDSFGRSAVATGDGYMIVGDTNEDINDGPDIFLIKTDLNGSLAWNKTIGGDGPEHGNAIIAVSDGYIIAGDTGSYGNRKATGVDASDVYLVKTDLNGNVVWNKTYGGKYDDTANSVAAVDDGYIIAGSTKSFSDASRYDVYLVKADLNGNRTWEAHFGGADDDEGKAVVPVEDGYVVTGYKSTIGNFYKDIYVLKTDLDGNLVWDQTYGGSSLDVGNAIARDGYGFAIAGYSCTHGIYTAKYCLLKLDPKVTPTPVPTAKASEPAPEPTAAPTTQAGGLSLTDMAILATATIVIVTIAGIAVLALYFYSPKK